MRNITNEDRRKYGCCDCRDAVSKMWYKERKTFCPHEKCPYKELKEYNSYEEYLEENKVDSCFILELFNNKKYR